ncbi:MAG TPA: efflux RND transporter periplasmic adaptor subunit [Myxococcales bacterium]|nr:efflux RND transporter periplasmic adaptor subunit [Myxococcales bacterium]
MLGATLRRAFWAARVALVRLRFIGLTAAAALGIAYADDLAAVARSLGHRAPAAAEPARAPAEYFCPMHPGVVRAEVGSCPLCGMPLSQRPIAKGPATAHVELSPGRVRLAGIATTAVERRALHKRLEAAATVEYDERRLVRVSTRFKGRVDRLYVDASGARVHKGQPLAALYVPELVGPAREIIKAKKAGSEQFFVVQQQLKLWGLSQGQIDRILASGDATHVDFDSPIAGTVVAKNIVLGESVMDGAPLFTIADLSHVWVVARLYEDEVGLVQPGQEVELTAAAWPGKIFAGRVSFVEPTVDRETRTVGARMEMPNPNALLKPGMFLRARFEISLGEIAPLAVLASSVIDAGPRRLVWREEGAGVFAPVDVLLGPRAGDSYPVMSGLSEGDRVVAQGAFLVDAESRLRGGAR